MNRENKPASCQTAYAWQTLTVHKTSYYTITDRCAVYTCFICFCCLRCKCQYHQSYSMQTVD